VAVFCGPSVHKSLGDDAAQPYRSPILGRLLQGVSVVILVAAAVGYIAVSASAQEGHIGWLLAMGLGLVVAIASAAGMGLYALGKKLAAPTVADTLAADSRAPVVYLRSFGADDAAATDAASDYKDSQVAIPGSTEEEHLAAVFGEIGPFIALGKPGETLATPGAARLYVSDDHWQASVTDWLTRCRLVLLRPGTTGGLLWEFQEAVTHLRPDQVVLAIAFEPEEYDDFRARVASCLRSPLPAHPGADTLVGTLQGLILFDEDWRGTFRIFPKKRRHRLQLRSALQPVLDRYLHEPVVSDDASSVAGLRE
jgi:hypothetical protein